MLEPSALIRMLIVDDDDVDRERVRRMVGQGAWNVDVMEADGGLRALELVQAYPFDCVVLDNHLGDANGADLLPQLQSSVEGGLAVIMVTGAGNESLAVKALQSGASDYLPKTQLSTEALVCAVQRSVEHHRVRRELDLLHEQLEQRVEDQARTIRQSERDLRALIDNAPTLMGYWDQDQCCRFGNEAHRIWFGVDPDALVGTRLEDLLGSEMHEAIRHEVNLAMAGEMRIFERTLPATQGRPMRHVQVQLCPDRLDDRVVQGFYATITDVTAIKLAQARVEELLRFSDAVIENSPIGIAVFKADGHGVMANAAFTKVGGTGGDWTSGTGQLIRHEWHQAGLFGDALHTLEDGLPRRVDLTLPAMDGLPMHLACALARVDRDGEPHVLVIARDVTERRKAHEALVAARDAAESAMRAKSTFLANMSHEIRTPMNAIVGLSRLALEDELPSLARGYLDKVHTSAIALMGILDDILDYSKIDAGHMHFERNRFSLEEIFQRMADLFQARIDQKGLSLCFDIAPHAPTHWLGDALRLSQVLTNLVGNAVKFTESGSVCIKVDVNQSPAAHDAAELRFAVIDTGIGLDVSGNIQLFDAFVQADSSVTRRFGGTGLGLAICKRLVQMMGGEIGVISQLGRGSEFWFTVRLEPCVDAGDAPQTEQLAGQQVVVVDGNPMTRDLLIRQLMAWHMNVHPVDNLRDGVSKLAQLQQEGLCVVATLLDGSAITVDVLSLVDQLTDGVKGGSAMKLLALLAPGKREAALINWMQARADAVISQPFLPSGLANALLHVGGAGQTAVNGDQPHDDVHLRSMALFDMAMPLAGVHVLLAEDNPLNQIVATELLKRCGITVTVVDDGVKAVNAFKESPEGTHAAILMDLHMPVLDGLEATTRIRALPGGMDVPIIGMTAAVLPEDRARCFASGMVDHLAKPVSPELVIQCLLKWVRGCMAKKDDPMADSRADSLAPTHSSARLTHEELDLPALRARVHGNEVLVRKLLTIFVEQERETSEHVADLLSRGDFEAARYKVHGLKGGAANLGVLSVFKACADLELAIKAGQGVDAALALFSDALQSSLSNINRLLDQTVT